MSETIRVLAVDDEALDRRFLRHLLSTEPIELVEADNIAEGLQLARRRFFDCALVDLRLPGESGLDFIRTLREEDHDLLPVVILTGVDDDRSDLEAVHAGAQDYLVKGTFDARLLIRTIRHAIERARGETLRRRLWQAERMALLGRLAAGMAHEINNPTAFVLANLDLTRRLIDDVEGGLAADAQVAREALAECRDMLTDCVAGVHRISGAVRAMQMLHTTDEATELVAINDVVRASLEVTRSQLPRDVRPATALDDVPLVVGSRALLGQLICNLLLNAGEAVRATGGQIRVATAQDDVGVVVVVEDDGPGVPETLIEHLFEPFVSGWGRPGIGLATCEEIVARCGGRITYRPGERGGAHFEVHLPLKPPASAPGLLDRRRLLLIDPDSQSREACARVLEEDHDVVAVSDSGTATSLLEVDGDFDAVLCDADCADPAAFHHWLSENRPELAARLVLRCGREVPGGARHLIEQAALLAVSKPTDLAELRAALRAVGG